MGLSLGRIRYGEGEVEGRRSEGSVAQGPKERNGAARFVVE